MFRVFFKNRTKKVGKKMIVINRSDGKNVSVYLPQKTLDDFKRMKEEGYIVSRSEGIRQCIFFTLQFLKRDEKK